LPKTNPLGKGLFSNFLSQRRGGAEAQREEEERKEKREKRKKEKAERCRRACGVGT
jgi:hypothetical protein